MRSDLDHLPAAKQRDLRWALDVLFSTFEEALKGKLSPERKQGRILRSSTAPRRAAQPYAIRPAATSPITTCWWW